MSDAGFVSVSIRLGLDQLARDAQAAAAKIRSSVPDTTVPVAIRLDNAALGKLAAQVQSAKAALAGESSAATVAGLQRETQLLQEALRFKAELAAIDDAGFSAEDAQNARILQTELNKINVDRIEQEFLQARAAGEQFTKSLQGELLKAQAGAASDRGDTGQAAQLQKQAALLQEATRYKKQLAEIENAYVDADDLARAKAIADELNSVNKQRIDVQFSGGDDLPRGLAGQAQAFTQAIDKASLYTQALSQVSSQLLNSGQQINAFTAQIAQASIAFDSAKANVATLSDQSEAFAQQARSLSEELKFQASSTEILTASLDVISAGFDSTAESSEILKASTVAAVGGLTSVATVADVTTSVLNSYKLSASEAGRVTDIIAQTVDDGKISFEQYAQGVGRITGIAAQAGVSIEEVSAAIATATAKGLPAESAISGVRQAIVNLIKPTNDAQAKLEQFGINNVSATLRTEGLVGVLARLQAAGATSDDLAKIFSDVDGLATVSQLAGANLNDFRQNLENVNNSAGKSAAAAAEIAKSFQGQLNVALNQANEAFLSMGNGVTKAIGALLPPLTFLIENFNALPEPIKESIGVAIALSGGVLTLAGAIAAVAAVLPAVVAGLRVMGLTAGTAATSTGAIGTAGTAAGAGANVAAAGAAKASVSFRTMATSAGALAIKMGLITIAIEAVKLALSRFKDGGAQFNQAADSIEQKLLDLQIESGKTRTELESALPQKPPPTDFIDGLVAKVNEAQTAINRATGQPIEFGIITTNAEKQLQDVRNGVLSLQTAIDSVVASGNELAAEFIADAERGVTPDTQQVEKAKQIQEAYTEALAKTQERLQSLDAAALGTDAYAELKKQLEGSIEQIEREKAAFERRTGLVDANAAATQNAANATGAATAATEEQVSAIEKLNSAYDANTKQIEAGNSLAQAEIAESVAQGLITEDEGRKQSLENEERYLNERLTLNRQKLAELQELLSTTTDPAQVKEIQSAIVDVESQVAADRLAIAEKLADARIEAERKATEEINRQIEDIDRGAQTEKTDVRRRQASGEITREDADAEVADIEASATQRSIDLLERRLAVVRQGSDEERDLVGQIGDLREEAANQEIARQDAIAQAEEARAEEAKRAAEEAARARIEAVERANAQAQAAIDRSQTDRTAQIRQQQVAGIISERQAAEAIRQIQSDTARASIAVKEQELASVRQLREEGVLSAEDAADREMALIDEIGQANLARIEEEMRRRREAAEEAIALQLAKQTQPLQREVNDLDLRSGAVGGELDLLNAQISLESSLADLQQAQLNTQVARAEAEGRSADAEEWRAEAIAWAGRSMLRQFELQSQQLELQIQQRDLELEREQRLANIAALEAEAELARARINGATQEELAALQEILRLRQEQVGAADDAITRQSQLNDLQRQQLATQQNISRQQQAQARYQQQAQANEARSSGSSSRGGGRIAAPSGSAGGRSSGGSSGGGGVALQAAGSQQVGQLDAAIRALGEFDPATQSRKINASDALSRLSLQSDNPFIEQVLAASGRSDILKLNELAQSGMRGANQASDLARQVDRGELSSSQVSEMVDRLLAGINRLSNSPRSLTAITPDPIRDVTQMASNMTNARVRGAGL